MRRAIVQVVLALGCLTSCWIVAAPAKAIAQATQGQQTTARDGATTLISFWGLGATMSAKWAIPSPAATR